MADSLTPAWALSLLRNAWLDLSVETVEGSPVTRYVDHYEYRWSLPTYPPGRFEVLYSDTWSDPDYYCDIPNQSWFFVHLKEHPSCYVLINVHLTFQPDVYAGRIWYFSSLSHAKHHIFKVTRHDIAEQIMKVG